MNEATINLINEIKQDVIRWRRELHQNPELSFREFTTSAYVEQQLRSFGNLDISRPTETSVVARLVGAEPGRVLAIRADMDALPIQEENEVDYRSINDGVMHACGHDGHTAMLLGAAKVLTSLKPQLKGEIRFIFQHGEEAFPGGASELVEAGVMYDVDTVIGAHLWTPLPVGKIGIAYGPLTAAPDSFKITITGKGGHAAVPHQSVDTVLIGAQIVTNLQHIAARNVDPIENAVVSVTQFNAGTADNIIPEEASISGTVRTFNEQLRHEIPKWIERIVQGITAAHGASYDLRYYFGYHPVINDEHVTRTIEETVEHLFGQQAVAHVRPLMIGEDFSAYLQKATGMFFLVGAGNEEKGFVYPHHHPRFDFDEESLQYGIQIFVEAAQRLLKA